MIEKQNREVCVLFNVVTVIDGLCSILC